MAAIEDTSFSSSSDTFSSQSTPPSSPDNSHDAPIREPDPRFGISVSLIPSLHFPHWLKAEEPHDSSDLSTTPTDSTSCLTGPSSPSSGECSKQHDQKHGFDNTAARHPIPASHNITRRSISLGRVHFNPNRMGATKHGKPRSQSLSELGSGHQEHCISSEIGDILSSAGDMPATKPSLSGPSPIETYDTSAFSSPDLSFVEVKSTECLPFEFDTSAISFETPSKKDEAEVRPLGAHGKNGSRRHTLGVNQTRLMNPPRGRPRSRAHKSIPPTISDTPGVHGVEDTVSNSVDPTQPEIGSFQSRSSHIIRDSMNTRPEIDFLQDDEPHHTSAQLRNTSKERMRQFSYTKKSLVLILPREMGQLLRDDSSKCAAFKRTQQNERCSRNHKAESHKIYVHIRRFISVDIIDASSCINGLVNAILCPQHAKLAGKDWERWSSILPALKPASNNVEDPRLPLLVDWIQELQDGVRSLGQFAGPNIKAEYDQVDTPDKPKATIQKLVPYCPSGQEGRAIDQILRELCTSPLSEKLDQKTGFIYIYWSPEGFGRMKIGYTKDINKRLEAWEKQCKRELYLHFPKEGEKGPLLPHVFRVERLIHAELKDYRRKEPRCPECNKGHVEWFEGLSVDLAVEVARKWIDWARREPYVQRDCNGKVKWMLSDEALESLKDVCKPHGMLRSGFCSAKS